MFREWSSIWLLVLMVLFILSSYSLLQLVKWLLFKFVIKPQKIKLPPLLIDLLGGMIILSIWLLMIREMFEVELTGLLVTSSVGTIILALALRNVVTHLATGVLMQIESPFSVGDWVQVAEQEGKIIEQNWRSLTLLTRMNHYIILTNSQLANENMINYSRPIALQAQEVLVDADNQYAPGKIKEALQKAVMGIDGIERRPAARAYVLAYGKGSIQYTIRYWISDYERKVEIEDAVRTQAWYALKRINILLAEPELNEINMRRWPSDEKKRYQATEQAKIQAFLRSWSLLAELNDAQIKRLAAGAQWQRYTTSEALVKQGAEGESLFIIKSGQLGVYIQREDGGQERVNERTEGEFFGEMSLLTGAPRSASVIAEAETEVIVIDKQPFIKVLMADPNILQLLLDALEKRRHNIKTKAAAAAARPQEQAKERVALVKQITNFLGISLGKGAADK